MFRTVSLSIIRSIALYTQQWVYTYVIQVMLTACQQAVSITCMYCCVYSARLLMMDRETVRNMQSLIPKINLRYVIQVLLIACLLASSQHNLYVLLCVQCQTPDDGQSNCPKHVVSYSENKFEILVHLVGSIIKIHNSINHLKPCSITFTNFESYRVLHYVLCMILAKHGDYFLTHH